jgi:hypothetical protein
MDDPAGEVPVGQKPFIIESQDVFEGIADMGESTFPEMVIEGNQASGRIKIGGKDFRISVATQKKQMKYFMDIEILHWVDVS